jgi:hypothetical protein
VLLKGFVNGFRGDGEQLPNDGLEGGNITICWENPGNIFYKFFELFVKDA